MSGDRSAARRDVGRRLAFPALVLALALFCVAGLQLLSSVVGENLASPPLVGVPAIDLRSSPPPVRPTAVAGAVVDVPPLPVEPGAPSGVLDGATPGEGGEPPVTAAAAPVAAEAAPEPELSAASAGEDDRPEGRTGRRHKADRRPVAGWHGAPTGRPVGPSCDHVPGRRASCDRRPTIA